jgi:hypothetical protein
VNNLAAFVIAAFRADSMLHAWFLTIRTNDSLRYAQRIVSPPLAAA